MKDTFLIITSIAGQNHPVLKQFAVQCSARNINFIVIGDKKSPEKFRLKGCDYFSIEQQQSLGFTLSKALPVNHYARKNIGYLIAISKGAETIIETDDDSFPMEAFWKKRGRKVSTHLLNQDGWINIYKHFSKLNIWPRGFALENIKDKLPALKKKVTTECPIQQGLVDGDPDVDAIYRFVFPLPVKFNKSSNIALGANSFCPFNSQNTTWFKETFLLLYLPSYCSFRMTDIWRSFVAQRIAWTCGWSVLFHSSTLLQKRNAHNLINDFRDEITGYRNNAKIHDSLKKLKLKKGVQNIGGNMILCYQDLINSGMVDKREMGLLKKWISDVNRFIKES